LIGLSEEYVKIESLQPYGRSVNAKVKIVNVGEVRVVSRGERRVADALVGDETASILLTLWDDEIERFSEDDVVDISNGYVSVFRGSMRLTAGRYGTITKIEEEIPEVNTDNNLSDREVEERQRFRRYDSGRGRSFRQDYGRRY
jgi:replication factor A1